MGFRFVWFAATALTLIIRPGAGWAQSPASANVSSVSSYLPTLDVTPPRFLRIEPDGTKDTSDYFDQVMLATSNRIFKFTAIPIPVYISPSTQDYFAASLKALDSWQSRTNGMIRFSRATNAESARITVIWSHLGLPQDPSSTEFGAHTITQWNVKKGGPFFGGTQRRGTVNPQIIEVNLDVIEAREPDRRVPLLQNLLTHELGHALGIIGHSPARGDMMFSNTDEYSRISQRDLNTLQKIYARNCDFPL